MFHSEKIDNSIDMVFEKALINKAYKKANEVLSERVDENDFVDIYTEKTVEDDK